MTRHFSPPAHDTTAMSTILIEAARCWREARDDGHPVQPSLFVVLSRNGHGMLAPVFDSFMTLGEAVSGRRISVGSGPDLSEDEHRLLGLLAGTGALPRKGSLAAAFVCAVRSTRIMMKRTLGASALSLIA